MADDEVCGKGFNAKNYVHKSIDGYLKRTHMIAHLRARSLIVQAVDRPDV